MTQLRLAPTGPALRLAPTGPALRFATSELRDIPWVPSWDVSEYLNEDPAEWQEGGRIGGMDLGWGTWPATRLRITARLSPFSTSSAFALEFGRQDTIDDGSGNPTEAWEVLDSSRFTVGVPYLLSMVGAPLVPMTVTAPVHTDGRYWSVPMPDRASVGLAAGAPAVLQMRVLAQLNLESCMAWQWNAFDDAWWLANNDRPDMDGVNLLVKRAAWQPRYAAELAFNAAARPFNLLFLVSAPSA
jgi:hypothetical protein